MKKNSFQHTWKSQTDIGRKFGISAIKVGIILKKHGLKEENNLATPKALDEGFAKNTPLKDGTPYFMWNVIKVNGLVSQEFSKISIEEQIKKEKEKLEREAEQMLDKGEDKMAQLLYECIDEIARENVKKGNK